MKTYRSKQFILSFHDSLTGGQEPSGGLLRLFSLLAEAFALYIKIRKHLPLPDHYSRLDVIEEEFILLWNALFMLRKKMGDIDESTIPVGIDKEGRITLKPEEPVRVPGVAYMTPAKKIKRSRITRRKIHG